MAFLRINREWGKKKANGELGDRDAGLGLRFDRLGRAGPPAKARLGSESLNQLDGLWTRFFNRCDIL
jgi:hypothetical protein